jgi:hypothetical protein
MSKLIAFVVAIVVAVLAFAVVPLFIRARKTPASNSCINNLLQLDGAKQQWQLENHKTTNDTPTLNDLAPYLSRTLVCPQGGTYTPERVGAPPRCSLGGPSHTFPQ